MSKNVWNKKPHGEVEEKYSTGMVYQDKETLLVCAVIKDACKEYKDAYKHNNHSRMQALENWFRSPVFDLWSLGRISGDYMIKELREQVETGKLKNIQHNRISKGRKRGVNNDN